jgi:hypothetical protein
VQYPINVSKDVLLVYNTTNYLYGTNLPSYGSNVFAYYTNNRPMIAGANSIALTCATSEVITNDSYNATFSTPISNWLVLNPTKRPQYVILFQDLPTRLYKHYGAPESQETSVQYDMHIGFNSALGTANYSASWHPFVTSINMDNPGQGINCSNYINRLVAAANASPGILTISGRAAGIGNTSWYFDDDNPPIQGYTPLFINGAIAVSNANANASVTYKDGTDGTLAGHIAFATNVAGFASWGCHGYFETTQGPDGTNYGYATNNTIIFSGTNNWYLIETGESFNGTQSGGAPENPQGNYISWFTTNAFGGTNGSEAPVGAVSNVDEPFAVLNNPAIYFGDWAEGRGLAYCGWNSYPNGVYLLQVVGDPFTKR